jgi:hypothetical protein
MKNLNEGEINKLILNHLMYLNETLVAGENVSAGDFVIKTTDREKLTGNLSNDLKYLYKLTDFTKSGKALIVSLDKINKWRNSTNVERVLMSKEINLDDYDVIEVEDEYVNFPKSLLDEGRVKSSKTKSGRKVPGKYLTKDKAAMKGEIERVSKLKSNDPDAYGKWVADYKARNTKSGKPHKTKKSAATIAYEKKFGKKNENMEKIKESYDFETQKDLNQLRRDAFAIEPEAQKIANYLIKKEITDISEVIKYLKEKNIIDSDLISRVIDLISSNKSLNKDFINEKTDVMIKNKAKASGISASILRQVYSRGAAAWKSGHRPGVSQQQWAAGRLNSFITGKGGARKADADLWAKAKKSKKRKNESVEEELLRKKIREIIHEKFIDDNLDELYPMLVGEDDLN